MHSLFEGPCAAIAVLALGLAPLSAAAQDRAREAGFPVSVGNRVRVGSSLLGKMIEGTLIEVDGEAVRLAMKDSGEITIPIDSIEGLEVAAGRKTRVVRGLVIGTVTGLLLGLTDDSGDDCSGKGSSRDISRAELGACLAVVGAIAGAGIGALIKTDSWTAVILPRGAPPSATRPGGVGASLVLTF